MWLNLKYLKHNEKFKKLSRKDLKTVKGEKNKFGLLKLDVV
ncbi:bacteriocin-like protein [Chryseobacterium daecheongense]